MNETDIPGPGKFEGNMSLKLSEELYELCGISAYDDQFGSVETGLWEALFLNLERNGEVKSYIVGEDTQGFFTYTIFDTEEEARAEWFGNILEDE